VSPSRSRSKTVDRPLLLKNRTNSNQLRQNIDDTNRNLKINIFHEFLNNIDSRNIQKNQNSISRELLIGLVDLKNNTILNSNISFYDVMDYAIKSNQLLLAVPIDEPGDNFDPLHAEVISNAIVEECLKSIDMKNRTEEISIVCNCDFMNNQYLKPNCNSSCIHMAIVDFLKHQGYNCDIVSD
jgi:hypothetical protein